MDIPQDSFLKSISLSKSNHANATESFAKRYLQNQQAGKKRPATKKKPVALKRKNAATGHRYPVTANGKYFSHISHHAGNLHEIAVVNNVALYKDGDGILYYQAPGKRGYLLRPKGFPISTKATLQEKREALNAGITRWSKFLKTKKPYKVGSRDEVFFGIAEKTPSGLSKSKLVVGQKGRIAHKSSTERTLIRRGLSATKSQKGRFAKK